MQNLNKTAKNKNVRPFSNEELKAFEAYENLLIRTNSEKKHICINSTQLSQLANILFQNKEEQSLFRLFCTHLKVMEMRNPEHLKKTFFNFDLKREKPLFPFVRVHNMDANYFKHNPEMKEIVETYFEAYNEVLPENYFETVDRAFTKWAMLVTPENAKLMKLRDMMKGIF